jgi:hypothetical protein
VVLHRENEKVADHRRSWGKQGIFFNCVHYLPLLERKPGALNYALPLADLNLPGCFDILHRRLQADAEREGEGTREYIRVLRLLEDHSLSKVTQAVIKGLRVRAHSRDAIAQFLIPQPPWSHPTFRLDGREHLRLVKVASPDIWAYKELLSRGGAT